MADGFILELNRTNLCTDYFMTSTFDVQQTKKKPWARSEKLA